jgi:hypothetical protein
MLREEERPVILRVLLAGPDLFYNRENPPLELHRLVFTHPRPCNEFELKKLSPAVDFSRSLVGVTLNQEGDWSIPEPGGCNIIMAAVKSRGSFPRRRSSG